MRGLNPDFIVIRCRFSGKVALAPPWGRFLVKGGSPFWFPPILGQIRPFRPEILRPDGIAPEFGARAPAEEDRFPGAFRS